MRGSDALFNKTSKILVITRSWSKIVKVFGKGLRLQQNTTRFGATIKYEVFQRNIVAYEEIVRDRSEGTI